MKTKKLALGTIFLDVCFLPVLRRLFAVLDCRVDAATGVSYVEAACAEWTEGGRCMMQVIVSCQPGYALSADGRRCELQELGTTAFVLVIVFGALAVANTSAPTRCAY